MTIFTMNECDNNSAKVTLTSTDAFIAGFQGDKLKLQAQIGSYPIHGGEFLVLVPFAKKESSSFNASSNVTPPPTPSASTSSNLADATWSNIMEDLSHLRDTTTTESGGDSYATNFEQQGTSEKGGLGSNEKQIELPYHHILNTLEFTSEGALGENSCEAFSKVLESVNCLSDLSLGHCKLLKRACLKGARVNDGGGVSITCLCPPWLKIVVKAFTFVNIFSAGLHLQRRNTTICLLEEALDRLAKFGVKLGLHDMKHLSLLCPHVNRLILSFFLSLYFSLFVNVYFFHLVCVLGEHLSNMILNKIDFVKLVWLKLHLN